MTYAKLDKILSSYTITYFIPHNWSNGGTFMKGIKLMLAMALFVTSISFQEQVIVTDQGLASNWEVSVGTSNAMALMAAEFE